MNTVSGHPLGRDNAPPPALVALAALALLVLVAVLTARLTGYQPDTPVLGAVVDQRLLDFRDLPGGEVEVVDDDSRELLGRFAAGEGSFLRGVVRSLVRQRRSQGVTAAAPFQLTRYSDGRLLISDPSTGESIDLMAFGPDNLAVFARLLPPNAGTAP